MPVHVCVFVCDIMCVCGRMREFPNSWADGQTLAEIATTFPAHTTTFLGELNISHPSSSQDFRTLHIGMRMQILYKVLQIYCVFFSRQELPTI